MFSDIKHEESKIYIPNFSKYQNINIDEMKFDYVRRGFYQLAQLDTENGLRHGAGG